MEVPNYNCRFVYFPFYLYKFLLCESWGLVFLMCTRLGLLNLLGGVIFLLYVKVLFVSSNSLFSEVYFI